MRLILFILISLAFGFNYYSSFTKAEILTRQESIRLTLIPTNVIVYGISTGSIDLTVSGGTLPYQYQWSNGANTEDIQNLPAGLYSVTVTDNRGCTANDNVTISQPTAMDINITIVQQMT